MLHVESRNKGQPGGRPPILLIHGAWHASWCWQNMLAFLADQGLEVHALDLRGHGASPATGSMRTNRIRHYVDDVADTVDRLGEAPILIGHSMGGFVVQKYLERRTAAGAVLYCSAPHRGVLGATLSVARHHPWKFLKTNLSLSLYPLVEDRRIARDLFLAPDTPMADALPWMDRLQDESYLAFLDMLALDLPRRPTSLPPMLVVAAEKDAIFSPASEQTLARHLGADYAEIAGAPHDLMLAEQWQQSAIVIKRWIDTAFGEGSPSGEA